MLLVPSDMLVGLSVGSDDTLRASSVDTVVTAMGLESLWTHREVARSLIDAQTAGLHRRRLDLERAKPFRDVASTRRGSA